MRFYKKESNRLNSAESFVKKKFPQFGVNKKQEITRLLYEISKRENNSSFESLFAETPQWGVSTIRKRQSNDYNTIKRNLLERRFPRAFLYTRDIKPYLPKLELNASEEQSVVGRDFYPKRIFIERRASDTFFARRFKQLFPEASLEEIESLKNYLCGHRQFKIRDYNKRGRTVFIVNEVHDFFKKCPCTRGALSCGYHIFNLGFGCLFECTYCFLQGYTNSPGIILPGNIDGYFARFNSYKKRGLRIGTGEFSDSLALDEFTGYSLPLVEFFRKQKGITFEFKTKSVNINNLLKSPHAGNIVVSWSLNPQSVIDENEFLTPSLKERMAAALKCVNAGYRIGFHFDPVIYFKGWEKQYSQLIEDLFSRINPKHIAWISIGTFRFTPGLKQVIEKRFPGNKILNEELLPGYDNKLRYPYHLRHVIYKKMLELLFKQSPSLKIYLCMENLPMWKDLKIPTWKF